LLLEPELDYVPGQLLLFCCPSKTPGLCLFLWKKRCRAFARSAALSAPYAGASTITDQIRPHSHSQ